MTVREAQARIDSPEFAEWMAYFQLEPFGPVREDQRAGEIAALIANVNRDTKAKPEPFTVEEFFPRYEDLLAQLDPNAEAGPPPDALQNKLTAWAMAMSNNAKESRGNSDKTAEAGGDGRPGRVARRGGGGTQDAPGPAPS